MKSVIAMSLVTCLSWNAFGGTTQVGSAGGYISSGEVVEYTPRSATVKLKGAWDDLYICNAGLIQDPSEVARGSDPGKYVSALFSDWNGLKTLDSQTPRLGITKKISTGFAGIYSESDSWGKFIHTARFQYHDWADSRGRRSSPVQYVVDVCYRAPQMEYFEDKLKANFKILSKAEIDAGSEGTKVQAFLVCDLQGEGDFKSSKNLEGQYGTSKNEAVFGLDAQNLPTQNGSKDFFRASGVLSLTGSVNKLLDLQIGPGSSKAPRFCKIRYVIAGDTTEVGRQSAGKHILLSVGITEDVKED